MEDLNLALLVAALTVIRFSPAMTHNYVTPVTETASGFSTAIASWNVRTPPGSWIETQLRARIGERWTRWYDMGEWSARRDHRHSIASQSDTDGNVDTDTLDLRIPAHAWQARVLFHDSADKQYPELSLFSVTTGPLAAANLSASHAQAWGLDLAVPERTQRVDESPDALAGGGDAWCSPTSVSMVMAYWARNQNHPQWDVDVASVAEGTYDSVYDGCGNWPFNVAFASEHGLAGWVERLGGLQDMQRYIAAGIPLIASIRVMPGELAGSPYSKTDGHLLVVRGFTSDGNVITNDPYAVPGHIRIVYDRAQFERVWLGGSGGIVYVIAPPKILARVRP